MKIEKHPLGYTKIVLFTVFGRTVRLHKWTEHDDTAPHGHRWGFVSIPLRGSFLDIRYRKAEGDEFQKVDAYPSNTGHRYVARTEWTGLVADAAFIRRPFRPYICRRDAIHSFQPLTATCTRVNPQWSLVFLGKPRTTRSELYR